jgi:hypothetical protein
MPSYNSTPFAPNPTLLQPGQPGYAFGSWSEGSPDTRMQVTTTARAASVATIGVLIIEGKIPLVGSLITVLGTAQAGGAFNVTSVAITAVSINSTTGVGTIQFAIGAGTTVQAADFGVAMSATPEAGEALTNTASQSFAIQVPAGQNESGRSITWSTVYPSAPGAVTMALQGSNFDLDSQYQTLDTSTNVNGDERVFANANFRFLRLKASGVSGGSSPTVIGKIYVG